MSGTVAISSILYSKHPSISSQPPQKSSHLSSSFSFAPFLIAAVPTAALGFPPGAGLALPLVIGLSLPLIPPFPPIIPPLPPLAAPLLSSDATGEPNESQKSLCSGSAAAVVLVDLALAEGGVVPESSTNLLNCSAAFLDPAWMFEATWAAVRRAVLVRSASANFD